MKPTLIIFALFLPLAAALLAPKCEEWWYRQRVEFGEWEHCQL